jgi:hypothetical protein
MRSRSTSDSSSGSGSPLESKRSDRSRRWRFWLDVAVKLTAPVGVLLTAIAAPFLVDHFQARTTALTLQNQREQSETSLRAAMFGYLISPIVGVQSSGAKIDADRYRLLVEMLALNFHENVEFKPLMEDADRRLALPDSSVDAKETLVARESLRTIARRVIYRQLAMLGEEPSRSCSNSRKNPSTVDFDLVVADGDKTAQSKVEMLCEVKNGCIKEGSVNKTKDQSTIVTRFVGSDTRLADAGYVVSPDCKDQLAISFSNPDEENHRIIAQFSVYKLDGAGQTSQQGMAISFTLTPYNFPFTDNTLLADGNRFAIYFLDVDPIGNAAKSFHVGLRWFPKNYFPPRERPTDFQQTRKRLGISVDAGK